MTEANKNYEDTFSRLHVTKIEPENTFKSAKDKAAQFGGHRHDQDKLLEPYFHDRQREHQRAHYRRQGGLYNESFCVDGLFDALTEDTGDSLIYFKRTLEGMNFKTLLR